MTVMERKIVQIDPDKCNGCGICVDSCHEGAIQMVDGKAKLVSDSYCDGLGDCLGPCPTGAISIITRKADAYDAEAVEKRMAEMKKGKNASHSHKGGCPGSAVLNLKTLPQKTETAGANGAPLPCGCPGTMARSLKQGTISPEISAESNPPAASQLMNWPIQLKLVPPGTPYLKNADLLLAADCATAAVPDFHNRFLKDKPLVIACPKLDDTAWQIEKLAAIIQTARPASITIVRMEVPCCGGLVRVAEEAIRQSGVDVALKTVVVGLDGTPA